MKTSSYDECEDRVDETNETNELETDVNVIFKKVNPVYFAESSVAHMESNMADSQQYVTDNISFTDTETTSAFSDSDITYNVVANTEITQVQNEIHSIVSDRNVNITSDQKTLQTVNESEIESSKNNGIICNSDSETKLIKTLEANEYRNIEIVSPEEVQKVESYNERWSDTTSQMSFPGQVEDIETIPSDTEPVLAQCEAVSEYYTASSEVSLLSDVDPPDKAQAEDEEKELKDDKKEGVIAGHVAAMRERFESMTRTNTPCPDLIRSLSPSLEVFRNTSPSPDRLV